MSQSQEKLIWETSPKYMGPALLVIFMAAGLSIGIFVGMGKINEAILACLVAIAFILLALALLLGELIAIGRRIEDASQSNSHKYQA